MESFYGAMKTGDTKGAMQHIAADAVFVESGRLENRAEYEGTFDGSPVNFVSAQLAVLSRQDGAWRIRSIHWSSRRR